MRVWYKAGGLEVASCDAAEAAPLIEVFRQIIQEQGWAATDLDDYLDYSTFFVATRDGVLIGGVKVVRGNAYDLPVDRVWPETNLLGRTDVVDLALTGLVRKHRGDVKAVGALWAAVFAWCKNEGVTELWTEVTPKYRWLYQRFLQAPLHVMGELRMHWGEPTLPCRILIEEQDALLDSRSRSSAVVEGVVSQVSEQGETA